MHIKVTEKNGTWNLWATEGGKDDEAPIYMASRRTRDQIVNLLGSIVGDTPALTTTVEPEPVRATSVEQDRKVGASQALYALLCTLDGWIEGAQENHDSLGHREDRGAECWRRWAPGDIRNMINDAARELGITGFPYPTLPKEDAR